MEAFHIVYMVSFKHHFFNCLFIVLCVYLIVLIVYHLICIAVWEKHAFTFFFFDN